MIEKITVQQAKSAIPGHLRKRILGGGKMGRDSDKRRRALRSVANLRRHSIPHILQQKQRRHGGARNADDGARRLCVPCGTEDSKGDIIAGV
jgi:hypothetical protein